MTVHHQDADVTVHHGDCLDVLRALDGNSVDAVVTDPPYGLGFMGKEWDKPGRAARATTTAIDAVAHNPFKQGRVEYGGASYGGNYTAGMHHFQFWCEQWAAECLRVLKPGGHMLAFGGTRTWHRLACAVEDAGFEVRDSIAWLYGSGFPKSLDIGKALDKAAGAEREVVGTYVMPADPTAPGYAASGGAGYQGAWGDSRAITAPATDAAREWDGWGTALKPGFEPVVVARKPLAGTVAANVLAHGVGGLNIDACRVPGVVPQVTQGVGGQIYGNGLGLWSQAVLSNPHAAGRWPTNVALDEHAATTLDAQTGPLHTQDPTTRTVNYGDARGASRFFPTFRYEAKAPTSERPRVGGGTASASDANRCAACGRQDLPGNRCQCPEPQRVPRGDGAGAVAHPTVKPLDLMRWLVRLVTPPGGLVLDPFAGSGTTAEAAILEGMRAVVVEREADYLPLIVQRITKPLQVGFDFDALTDAAWDGGPRS